MAPKFFKLQIRDDEEILGLTIWKPVIDKLLQHLGVSQQETDFLENLRMNLPLDCLLKVKNDIANDIAFREA